MNIGFSRSRHIGGPKQPYRRGWSIDLPKAAAQLLGVTAIAGGLSSGGRSAGGRPDRGHGLLMQAGGDGLAAAGRGWRDLMCGVAGVGDTDTMAEQE